MAIFIYNKEAKKDTSSIFSKLLRLKYLKAKSREVIYLNFG